MRNIDQGELFIPVGDQLRQGILPDGFSATSDDESDVIVGPAEVPPERLPVRVEHEGRSIGIMAVRESFDPHSLQHTRAIGFERGS